MFIAMNRFRIRKGMEGDFEDMWLKRDSHLQGVAGFVAFHLLKGPAEEDYTLYASHSVWATRGAFEDWTRSDAFRAAHAGAGAGKSMYLGGPHLEMFDVRQTVEGRAPASR